MLVVGKFVGKGSSRVLGSGGMEAKTPWINTEEDFVFVDLEKRGQRKTGGVAGPSVEVSRYYSPRLVHSFGHGKQCGRGWCSVSRNLQLKRPSWLAKNIDDIRARCLELLIDCPRGSKKCGPSLFSQGPNVESQNVDGHVCVPG